MKNFVSPHCHLKSLDTGATIESFAKKEKQLETGYLTCTDHGSMAAARQVFSVAKKNGLVAINGCEFYLRDDDCEILKKFGIPKDANGSYADFYKYAHVTAHFQDNDAFEAASRLLSKADERAERHGSERKPLFSWNDLEELGSHNVTFCSSCLVGIVGRFLVKHNRPDIAIAYYEKLRSLVKPGNFYVELFPHRCTHYWESGTFITLEDGERLRFHAQKNVRTSLGEHKLDELIKLIKKQTSPVHLIAVKNYSTWNDLPEAKRIVDIQNVEDFLLNECRPWAPDSDYQLGMNRFMYRLANKYGDKILISDDAHFSSPEDKIVQDIRLQSGGGSWRFHNSYHRQSSEEAYEYFKNVMNIDQARFESWVENSHEWASKFKDFQFKKRVSLPTNFYPADTLKHTMELVKRHGRMQWNNPAYVQRLKDEVTLLHRNGVVDLLAYFFVDEEVCNIYANEGLLTGPGRGSAAGMLLTYLLGITHVDPLKFGLSMDRFLTLDRIQSGKLPDIDLDLPSRDLLVGDETSPGWLSKRFGDNYCQVSVDTTLKLKSSIKDVARVRYGKVPPNVEALCGKMSVPPQGISDRDYVFGYVGADGQPVKGAVDADPYLQAYIREYPEDWDIVQMCLGLDRQKGRHASAFLICNEPIQNFIPQTSVSGVRVTQFTANSAEEAGALKYDFLVVNSLKDVSDAIKLVQERQGFVPEKTYTLDGKAVPGFRVVPHGAEQFDIWNLPEDQAVFNSICESNTETVFQFNTPAAKQWLRFFNEQKTGSESKLLDSIEALAAFTALDRPGPLDAQMTDETGDTHNMLVEYARRARLGVGNYRSDFPILDQLLPETYGIIVYQEQLTRIFKEIGQTTGIEAENFRVHISKKQMAKVSEDRELFMKGAVQTLGKEGAEQLWGSMFTFGQYGFNKSHAVCYVTISYACAFLKHHYPLEWWTAVLRNADKNEISEKFWPHCGHLINLPDIKLSKENFAIVNERIQAPTSLLQGIGAMAHEELVQVASTATDLTSLFQNIYNRRVANGKDGKLGRSALSRRVMYTLIVSGTMDSFFDANATMLDKLMAYEAARAVYESVAKKKPEPAEGKRKSTRPRKEKSPEPVDPAFVSLTAMQVYQLRKSILPAYCASVYDMIVNTDAVKATGAGYAVDFEGRLIKLVKPDTIDRFDELTVWPTKNTVTLALPCYIQQDDRRFFGPQKKEMAKVTLESEGRLLEFIKWPDRGEIRLKNEFKESLTGSVGVAILERYSLEKPFNIKGFITVQPPFKMAKEESSD